ncbi:protein NDR1/HIN1-like 22 [Hibiscus syriacus]|uniref:Protein NDR1/HIN1-like 22 n=1 Tax=Hibiscus syriacus TaxID=106335 RepID=A0A6A3BF46_HIBSY|nr:protein NDR1/HIN1-like 22 [Hibiscus syriacus]
MAAPRNVLRDEESAAAALLSISSKEDDDSSSGKRLKSERFPVSRWELAAFFGVFLIFSTGLFCIYLTMPATEYGKLKIPRSISNLRLLKDNIATYAKDYPTQFILGYCSTYIFMQTFMIPGTIFMSLLAGAFFGVKGLFLVVFNATTGACSCFFSIKADWQTFGWPRTLQAGLALGDLRSVKDLYDFKTLSVLFLIGMVSIFPTLLKKKKIYE